MGGDDLREVNGAEGPARVNPSVIIIAILVFSFGLFLFTCVSVVLVCLNLIVGFSVSGSSSLAPTAAQS